MIGFLRGQVIDLNSERLLLDVGGVGYEVFCSVNILTDMQNKKRDKNKDEVFLWIYTQLREDSLQLYGFLSKAEKDVFLSLLTVNGIGPKLAIRVLSGTSVDQLIKWIDDGSVEALTKLPKVGKKTAEQMVLALKGKLERSGSEVDENICEPKKVELSHCEINRREIVSALVHLGYTLNEVERAMERMPKDLDISDGVRQALVLLSRI